jgi:hypothetical protein
MLFGWNFQNHIFSMKFKGDVFISKKLLFHLNNIEPKMSTRQSEDKLKKWKNKAFERQLENKKLKRRLQEVIQSRDHWKQKYQGLCKAEKQGNLLGEKAFGHQYPIGLVLFIVLLQQYGQMSLRSCRYCIICLRFIGLRFREPSHSSVRNWVCKCGYYRVHKRDDLSGSYVLYVDESISFGSEKILLILGVPSDKIPAGRSVQHSDVVCGHWSKLDGRRYSDRIGKD